MILRAAAEHSLDLPRSVLVGDKTTDVEAGRAAGVGCCVLVRSGHPLDEADVAAADSVFENLPEVASALGDNQLCAGSGA
jgi:D-glycero-D-manno-heptose 1,7-bisphosphate phosphatase